jgi:hypothetical protein
MWFADIITDISWLSSVEGRLGTPRSRAKHRNGDPDLDLEFLVYGDELQIRHLRVLIDTDTYERASACVDQNIGFWTNLLEVASLVASPTLCTVARLQPNSTRYCVFLAEGDEHTPCLYFRMEGLKQKPTDYEAVATLITGWRKEFNTHLFFLSRFLNHALPPETRWLNGYRLLEWHFMRGRTGLPGDTAWRCFLEEHGETLDPFLREQQTRYGLIEETRALVSHAMLQNRPDPDTEGGTLDLVTKTFKSLERLVVQVMNEGAREGILWRVNE